MKLKIEFYRNESAILDAVILLLISEIKINIKSIKDILIRWYPDVPQVDLNSFGKGEFSDCENDDFYEQKYNQYTKNALSICKKLFKNKKYNWNNPDIVFFY